VVVSGGRGEALHAVLDVGARWLGDSAVLAEQRSGELRAAGLQLRHRGLEVALLHPDRCLVRACERGRDDCAAGDLAEERRGQPLRRRHCRGEVKISEPGAGAVEPQQPLATGGVGRGDLDGLVDSAGALGECALEHLNPVGGEDEHHVDVVTEAVELIEDLKQQRIAAGRAEAAVAGNQSTSSRMTTEGWWRLASSHAAETSCSATPDSTTAVTPSSRPSR
jgi:hypothetical protein